MMDEKAVLSELGLSEGEIKVYLALLKLGPIQVSKIKEETKLHRTTIYDFLEKLLNKGLASYVVRNNVKYYNAADPNMLVGFLKEKQEHLNQILPELNKLAKFKKEEVKVEVYKGTEGLKTVMLDAIRAGQDIVGMGIDESCWKKKLPVFTEQYQRMLKENNIHEYILTKANPEFLFDQKQTHYKFVSASYFSPTSTLIYADKILLTVWEPSLTSVLIENKQLAQAYRQHFNALWEQESMVFRGEDEIKSVFSDMIKTLKPEDEYIAFGVPSVPRHWVDYFDGFCSELEKKKVTTRIIIDEKATPLLKMTKKHKSVNARTLSQEHMTPSEVDIYGDKVAIILWAKEPQAFVIKNKQIANSFKKYFELLWKVADKTKP